MRRGRGARRPDVEWPGARSRIAVTLLAMSAALPLAPDGASAAVDLAPAGAPAAVDRANPDTRAHFGREPGQDPDSDSTVLYRRPSWSYPSGPMRNPFRPPSAGDRAGPPLERLRLSGILYSPDVGSVAVLVDDATGRRHRMREGDVLGTARLVAVRAGSVTFAVREFGMVRRVTMNVRREPEQEPSP